MKKVKGILALVLALVMFLALPMPASAISADATTIIVSPATEGSAYEAHTILYASRSDDQTSVAYTVEPAYEGILRQLIPTGDIVAYISTLSGKDLQEFASKLYGKIKEAGIEAEQTASASEGEAVLEWMTPGYILVGQTQAPDQETFSAVMLDTGYNMETVYVRPKVDTPSIEKKVLETNDSTGIQGIWQDAADYDAEDSVPFKITATLPDNLSAYEKYTVKFHDSLSNTLAYNQDMIIYALDAEGNKEDITTLFSIQNSSKELTISCDDILKNENIKNKVAILVEYSAKLSSTPIYGSAGNPNTVYMEYSRNPHGNEMGQTAIDKVNVFSYQVKVNKINDREEPLDGASFSLYKYIEKSSSYELVKSQKSNSQSEFLFYGLDAGQYKLVETSAPWGYNKIEPIEFKVEASYDSESADPALTRLTAAKLTGESLTGDGQMFACDLSKGELSTKVVNKAGCELPSTGGRGALLLYSCGGILIILGGIFLFLKRGKKNLD